MTLGPTVSEGALPGGRLDELRRFSGVQFDPVLVKEFLCIVESCAQDVDVTVLAESTAAEPESAGA